MVAFQNKFYAGGGVWVSNSYQTDGTWGRQQWPALAEAIFSRVPSGQQPGSPSAEAQVATDTLNAAITNHQLADGNFGTSTSDSPVNGCFWAVAEGATAWVLQQGHELTPTQLTTFEQSMVKFVNYTETSGNAPFYINGNVNICFTTAMLEAWKLAQAAGDAAQATMLADYQAEQTFVMDPCAHKSCNPQTGAWGWHQGGATQYGTLPANAGYFSESPGNYPGNWWCDNTGTCYGLDPYYASSIQLNHILIGYLISGYDSWWQNLVTSEANTFMPLLIDGGNLNASNGSRHSAPQILFDPSIWSILDEHDLAPANVDTLWAQYNTASQSAYASWEKQTDTGLGPNPFSQLTDRSLGVLDNILAPTAGDITGDLNGDGHVNGFDLSIFLNHWQQPGAGLPEDFNGDGTVNSFDLSILLTHYGT